MRIGRGHRDARQIYLFQHLQALLKRSQHAEHYGNPHITTIREILANPQELLRYARRNQAIHRSTVFWENYYGLKSANQGFSVAVKDNINTCRLPTTCASNILRGFQPPRDATVTQLLEKAGLVLLSKTNMDEFGMGSHSRNSAFGPMFNGSFRKEALSVGGSSGGSALAVAARLAQYGIGTDTGGSVRLPAAYMSLFGFKPSYGRISRNGVIPYANSLDTVGIIAPTAGEVRLMFDILDTPDGKDPTCLTKESRHRIRDEKNRRETAVQGSVIKYIGRNARPGSYHYPDKRPGNNLTYMLRAQEKQKRFRVGVPLEYNIAEMHPMVRWAWIATLSHLQTRNFEIVPISLPSTKHALSAYYILAPAEASSNLAKFDGVRYGRKRSDRPDDDENILYANHRYENFGPEVRRRILLGTYSLSAGAMDNYYIQAQKIRRMVQNDFDSVFRMRNPLRSDAKTVDDGVDLIICPTAPTPPPHVDFVDSSTPMESYMNDVFTVPASLAGLPSITVPGPAHPEHPWNPELAVGMQIIGQYGDDFSVLYMAQNHLEQLHDPARMRRLQSTKRMSG